MQLKASGMVPGIPDCIFLWQGRGYGFEFKTDVGRLSDAQVKVHAAWQGHAPVYVVRTLEDFKAIVLEIIKSA